jgi:hypothetical protein
MEQALYFWTDRWLHGHRMTDIAPRLFATIPKRRINKCTIKEAITARKWISDIQGALFVGVIIEFLHLWDILLDFELQPFGDLQRVNSTLPKWPMMVFS